MFDLVRPCMNCPFRRGQGELFRLDPERLEEILNGVSFQCHKTVVYDQDDGSGRAGDKPQQCAGLMGLLHRENRHNQIMQLGERLGHFDPDKLILDDVYESIAAMFAAHKED